jgi:hypothetical protein
MYKMVYFQAAPVVVSSKLAAPRAEVHVDGKTVDQPICQSAEGTPVWAAMVPTADIEATRKKPEFLGVGLDEVKTKFPAVYGKIAEKSIQEVVASPSDPKKMVTVTKRVPMDTVLTKDQVLIAEDLVAHSFAGVDAKTGGGVVSTPIEGKPIEGKPIEGKPIEPVQKIKG